jgi:DNA-binding NarL/FixJ family response regulator
MTPIRVLLADDAAVFRSGVRTIFSTAPDVRVVAEAADGAEAARQAERERPDVALLDLKMPGCDGVEATRRIRVAVPSCQVVILTTFDEDDLLFAALRAGAAGYLLKDLSADHLLEAVRAAARGESLLAPRVVSKVVAEFARLPPGPARGVSKAEHALSTRELEVLTLLARGAVNKEIAAALGLSEGTVKNHLTSLFSKLGVSHRTQAALRARELGLL